MQTFKILFLLVLNLSFLSLSLEEQSTIGYTKENEEISSEIYCENVYFYGNEIEYFNNKAMTICNNVIKNKAEGCFKCTLLSNQNSSEEKINKSLFCISKIANNMHCTQNIKELFMIFFNKINTKNNFNKVFLGKINGPEFFHSSYIGDMKKERYLDENNEDNPQACYQSCLTCSESGDKDNHKCNKCQKGHQLTTGLNSRNCVSSEEIEPEISEMSKFFPLKDEIKKIKIVPVKNEHSFYFYKTSSVITYDISYITIDNCELSSGPVIGLIVNNKNTGDMKFKVYSSEGSDLTLSCEKIEKNYFRVKDPSSLVYRALSLLKEKSDIYDPKDSVYSDPCVNVQNGEDYISISKRREMFLAEIQECPSDCEKDTSNLDKARIKCLCPVSSTEKPTRVSISSFDKIGLKNSFYLFRCYKLFDYYLGGFIQWIILVLILSTFVAFGIMEATIDELVIQNFTKPKRNNSRKMYKKEEKFIELSKVEENRGSYIKKKKTGLSILSKKTGIGSKSTGKSPFLSDQKKQNIYTFSSNENPRTVTEDFLNLVTNKLFIFSLFTNKNPYYLIYMRIFLNVMVFILIVFLNAIFYQAPEFSIDKPFRVDHSLYSCLISLFIYKIIFVVVNAFGNTKESLKLCSILEFVFVTICNIVFWYYLFIFSIVYNNYQGFLILLSLLSILFFFAFQVFFAFLTAIIRPIGLFPYSQTIHCICKFLDTCF